MESTDFFEKLPLKFDVERLKDHFENHVKIYEPVMVSQWFGGWSVLSATGTYSDGWSQASHLNLYMNIDGREVPDLEKLKELGLLSDFAHNKPTEIYSGYLAHVVTQIYRMGFVIGRVRLALLKAGGESSLHRDGTADMYGVRLHVPIITNPGCRFWCEAGEAHFPADGSAYIVKVNQMHQIVNRGSEDRIHLLMNIVDTKGITSRHKYNNLPLT